MSSCATEECKCNKKAMVESTGTLDLFMFTTLLAQEVELADAKHGTWEDKTVSQCLSHLIDELDEVVDASIVGDKDGEHGMKAELVQVACTAYKMWRAL